MIPNERSNRIPIPLERLSRYLRAKGWSPTIGKNRKWVVFVPLANPDQPAIELVLPTSARFSDSALRTTEALETLAALESRSVQEVTQSIQLIDRDVMQVAIGSDSYAALSLRQASEILFSLKNLFAYSAASEIDPRAAYSKPQRQASDFVEKQCLFGHTTHNSFGFSIEAPIRPRPQLSHQLQAEPFERRVVERICLGLAKLNASMLVGSSEPLVSSYLTGFNANMCENVANLIDSAPDEPIKWSVTWSPEWNSPDTLADAHPTVTTTKHSIDYLKSAADELRLAEIDIGKVIRGPVVMLWTDAESMQRDMRVRKFTIVIEHTDDNNRKLRVHVSLNPEQHRLACDAHKNGKTVQVRGNLEHIGKHWVLTSLTEFTPAL